MGDYDSIYGFAALGLDTFSVSGQEDAENASRSLQAVNMQSSI